MAIILYILFVPDINSMFYFCKQSSKVLPTRLRTEGHTGSALRSIACMFSIFLCSYLLCSPGSLGNVKGFAHLSSWLFLYSNAFSLNNVQVRVLCCI